MSNRKLDVSKAQNERHKQILQVLLKQEDNRRCADCNARGPTWASVNLGLFVCLNCSGHHRSLGVHISKVRSATLDTWLPEQVCFVQQMGNRRANEYWEARLPRDFRRPAEGDMTALAVFIGDKYRNQAYTAQQYREPPTIENYTEHPFMAGSGAKEAAPADTAAVDAAAPQVPAGRGPVTRPGAAGRAAAAAGGAPSKAEPASDLFDLLNLEESAPVATRATTTAFPGGAAAPPAAANDAGWAAWDTADPGLAATTPAPTPAPATLATPPPGGMASIMGLVDHEWDAFQSGQPPAEAQPTPRSSDDPFAGSAADPFLAGPTSGGADFATFAESATPAKADSPPKKSHDDILKMFDMPRGLGSDPLGGFIPAFPSGHGLTPTYQQASSMPATMNGTPQPLNFGTPFPGMGGFPAPHMGTHMGTPANFAGLHLHAGPVAAGGAIGGQLSFPNMAGKPAPNQGSLF